MGANPPPLKSGGRASGEINWLMGVIAAGLKTTASVIGNFEQVVKEGEPRLHPIIVRLVDKEMLERIGAARKR